MRLSELKMRKLPIRLTIDQRCEILRRASAINIDGNWAETYRAIANAFNVTLQCVTMIARNAGLPQRQGRTGRPRGSGPPRRSRVPIAKFMPQSIEERQMYDMIRRKLGSRQEARRIMLEHRQSRLHK